jgi:hypothetical protein
MILLKLEQSFTLALITFISQKSTNRVLEVVSREDGTFDLFMNGELDRGRIPVDGLNQQLCVRFGFCGDECDSILHELAENGRKKLFF